MNAVNALFREEQEAKIADALAAAGEWTDVARAVIRARCAILAAAGDLDSKGYRHEADRSTYREASAAITEAARELEQMLDGIRDNFIADQRRSVLSGMSEAEIESVDAFNDVLDEETMSVRDVLKLVEREDAINPYNPGDGL